MYTERLARDVIKETNQQPKERAKLVKTTPTQKTLTCDCGAVAADTTKERGRFLRRHPLTLASTEEEIAEHIADQRQMRDKANARAAAEKAAAARDAANAAAKAKVTAAAADMIARAIIAAASAIKS